MKTHYLLILLSAFLFNISSGFAADRAVASFEQISLINFESSPQSPRVGESISIFVRLNTGWSSSDEVSPILQFSVDGSQVDALHPSMDLWVVHLSPSLVAGDHNLYVNLFLEDKDQADAIRASISLLNQDISTLDSKILIEEDLAQKLIWQSQRDQKIQQRSVLNDSINATRTYVGTDLFKFAVSPIN